ncbi:CE57L protein, partial [Turnix velox]|nr:CE57L protein [Turnix velox]
MDSESKNNLIGSFLQPPDKMLPGNFAYIESKKLAAVGGDKPSVSNIHALLAALKTLQEKIHHLELEKSQAEDNLRSLSIAAAQYRKALKHQTSKKDSVHQELMQHRKGISVKLNAAQSRCSLLEKQLDYMRKMVSRAELEKKMVLEQQAQLQKEDDQNWLELHAKPEKLERLERKCLKLSATLRIAEDKIKYLEEKLRIEEHQCKLLQDKTAQLQTGFEINRILMSSVTPQHESKKKNKKKKKTKKRNPTTKKTHPSQLRITAGELPFVAGKVTTSGISGSKASSKPASSCSTLPPASRSLSDLLVSIQDELDQMSLKHQELLKKIQESQDPKVRKGLERELDCLVKQMEMKEEQISKLKNHHAIAGKLKRKAQKLKQGAAPIELKCSDKKEAKETVVTVKKSLSKSCPPGQKSRSSLQLLKNVQKIQSALKKDDVMWEQ